MSTYQGSKTLAMADVEAITDYSFVSLSAKDLIKQLSDLPAGVSVYRRMDGNFGLCKAHFDNPLYLDFIGWIDLETGSIHLYE